MFNDIKDDKVIVAFSGGGDSSYLLLKAKEHFKEVIAVHIEYQEESHKNIHNIPNELGIKLIVKSSPNISQHKSRKLRLDILSLIAKKENTNSVLLGHNRDDLLETFLMRLERSSTSYGLASMSNKTVINNINFYRPLLNLSREYIRDSMKDFKYIDSTLNLDDNYRRNYIRINNLTSIKWLNSINKIREERRQIDKELTNYIKDFSSISEEKIILNKDFLQIPSYFHNFFLRKISNFLYPSIEEDFSSIINKLRVGSILSFRGVIWKVKKGYIEMTREKNRSIEICDYSRYFISDKRYIYDRLEGEVEYQKNFQVKSDNSYTFTKEFILPNYSSYYFPIKI